MRPISVVRLPYLAPATLIQLLLSALFAFLTEGVAQAASWTTVGSTVVEHVAGDSLLLADGTVLIVGGDWSGLETEIYDPTARTWSQTGFLHVGRIDTVATLLADGRVLVAGGAYLRSAELFDPTTRMWAYTASMASLRRWAAAVLLLDGRVLVTGGADASSGTRSCEAYEPTTESWTATGLMLYARRTGRDAAARRASAREWRN